MAIFRRGNKWWYKFVIDGKLYRGSCQTTDEREAREFHDRVRAQTWRSLVVRERPDRLVAEAIELFLKERRHKRSFKDDERYAQFWLEQFAAKGVRRLSQLDAEAVREIRDAEMRRKLADGRCLSAATVNRKLAFLRAVLRTAEYEWQWIVGGPRIKMLQGERQRERYLTAHEVQRLIGALPFPFDRMATFAVSTGLRQGNVLGLKWFQVDMANRCIRFPDRVMKNGRPFAVALGETAMGVLRQFVGKHDEYVFVTSQGTPIRQVPSKMWRKALQRAGIEDLRWHDLRHTWASLMRQSGMGLDDLQELGGWESALMVRRYAHLSVEHLRQRASAVDGILAPLGTKLSHSPHLVSGHYR